MKFYQETPKQGVICNYGITDHFKTGYLSVDFVLPLTSENATGMSLLAGVVSRGCKAYPQMGLISRYLAKNYGASISITANKAGETEILTFAFTHLENEYALDGEDVRGAIIALLKDMIFDPLVQEDAFDQDYVEQEKVNLNNKIVSLFNDKRVYSLERCKSLMCEGEPFGINEMGDPETLKLFDATSLYRFYQKVLNESYVVISYVGKNKERFLGDIASRFSARDAFVPDCLIKYTVETSREVIEPMDLNQSKLNMGYRLGKSALKNGAACRLFNIIFGGSATSKLFTHVRERLSLCYYCSSGLDRFKNVMFVSSGIESDKYEEARREIETQLHAVATGDFTDEEFENARAYLVDSLLGVLDNESALTAHMLSCTLRGELRTPEQEIADVMAVTREEIVGIAAEAVQDTVYLLKGVHTEA